VDGGVFDDTGALAVLRRGVSSITICDACVGDVDSTCLWDLFHKDEALEKPFYDLAALFGRGKSSVDPALGKKNCTDFINLRGQVFEKGKFDELMDKTKELKHAGKPMVHKMNPTLIANKYNGICEPREVEAVFCVNDPCTEFDKLSNNRAHDHGGRHPFVKKDHPPLFRTFQTVYSAKEVNELSSISGYTLVEGPKNVGFDIDKVEK
jgi:hypothetical protein